MDRNDDDHGIDHLSPSSGGVLICALLPESHTQPLGNHSHFAKIRSAIWHCRSSGGILLVDCAWLHTTATRHSCSASSSDRSDLACRFSGCRACCQSVPRRLIQRCMLPPANTSTHLTVVTASSENKAIAWRSDLPEPARTYFVEDAVLIVLYGCTWVVTAGPAVGVVLCGSCRPLLCWYIRRGCAAGDWNSDPTVFE